MAVDVASETFTVNSTTGKVSIDKDPNDILDYNWDFTAWLGGDTISSFSVPVDGVTLASSNRAGAVVTAFISGGTVGTPASATCRIVTTNARTKDQTIYFKIKEK